MMINQNKEDGSGELVFSKEEIDIIIKHKKLILTPSFLKHFVNLFVGLFIEFQDKFDKKTKQMTTFKDQEIKTNPPKERL
jgi:hypothetical protein